MAGQESRSGTIPARSTRAWTVHQIIVAPNEWNAYDMMNTGTFDLRTTALMVQSKPSLATCSAPDNVTAIDERVTTAVVSESRYGLQRVADCQR